MNLAAQSSLVENVLMQPSKIKGMTFLRKFGIEGIVLYPFILFASKQPDPAIENHEDIHCQQIRRDGFLGFYRKYLWEYSKGRMRGQNHDAAYRNISYEQEAYLHQKNLAYKVT